MRETDADARQFAQLAAQFPLVTTTVAIGERDWQITAVQNQDVLLDAANNFEHFPFGFLLWESAVGLARSLCVEVSQVAGKRILELGAGVGVPGMVAQGLGAQVWQTDHQSGALVLARHNARQNGITGITHFIADWRAWQHTAYYDLILGADILYERTTHFHLETIFRQNLAPNGVVLLSDPGRPQALEFAAHLENSGWNLTLETLRVTLDQSVEVGLLTAKKVNHPLR